MTSRLTVTTASETYDLTLLSTVKTYLEITDRAQDALLTILIRQASAAAASYCNRVFAQETLQEEFWATRDLNATSRMLNVTYRVLTLSRWPVTSVTSVVENDVTLVEDTDFLVVSDKGQLLRIDANGNPRAWPSYKITVVYVAGYQLLQTLPWDIEDAVIRMVKARWITRTRDPSLRQQNIPGVLEQTFWIPSGNEAGAMTPDVTDLLDGYRVPVTAA